MPKLLRDGARVIPPQSRYPYFYHIYPDIVNNENLKTLDVEISYLHSTLGDRINEIVHIDFMNYFETLVEESEWQTMGKSLKDAIENLTREVKDINRSIDKLSWISSSSGLDLSFSSVENLKHVIAQDGQFEKLNPSRSSYSVFIDMLDVDSNLAWRLQDFFNNDNTSKKLRDLEGINDRIINKMQKMFDISEYL